MAWLTAADSTNQILKDYREQDEYGFTYSSSAWNLQKRTVVTTVYEYVGIDKDSAASLVSGLRSTTGTTECYYQESLPGGGSIIHSIQTYGSWTTV